MSAAPRKRKTSGTGASGGPDPRLDRARAAWQSGDWDALAAPDADDHPERARLVAMAAVARFQRGETALARAFVRQALDGGLAPAAVARLVLGGALNGLGRVAALLGDETRATDLFGRSVAAAAPGAPGRDRMIREMARTGLLPDAARMMGEEFEAMQAALVPAQAGMLRAQMDLIRHELFLAAQRRQLFRLPGTEDDTATRAMSQLGQDLWVLEQTGHKHGGFFVEFGASDGILLSNTYLLETEYGWQGICAEPNPALFASLKANRRCIVAPDCITARTGERVEFVLADEYGGVAAFADRDSNAAIRQAFRDAGHVIEVETISLDDFLKKHGAPRRIDYLSIDTEGTEYEILRDFPFPDWDIGLITVEHNFTEDRDRIRALLEAQGYSCTEARWDDWYARPPLPPTETQGQMGDNNEGQAG